MKIKFTGTLRPGARTRDRREEGMSEWSEFELAPDMSLSAAMQMMQLDHWLGEIEKSARACLADHGIEGNWLRASEEAERRFGKGSLPWFAAEMWGDAQGVHRARARGDIKNQEWHAFHCGCAFTEWRIKIAAERDANRGRANKRTLDDLRDAKNAAARERADAERREIKRHAEAVWAERPALRTNMRRSAAALIKRGHWMKSESRLRRILATLT